ncbi:lipase [Lithospermum erythrorhizon]|uniref:Lipase n=1 Tax=Lithospermum erythrorhizon TaxID=34254 RepID=A0AAV3NRN1_LITER
MAKEGQLAFLCLMFHFFMSHFANASKVPAIFILGDSTADVGTNSYLNRSHAKANFPYHGIDFPGHRATGRFSNGFNSADYLAMLMGARRSPSSYLFLQTLGSHRRADVLRRGANFASAGSGILDSTGSTLGVLPLYKQILQLVEVYGDLEARLGRHTTKTLLGKSLFFITTGSNDIFGYFATNTTVSVDEYIDTLIDSYDTYIRSLYGIGARKFGIISVPPVGCCPSQRIISPTGDCFEPANQMAQLFHSKLVKLLCKLSSQLQDLRYSLGNAYEMTMNVINHPNLYGFTNVNTACCGKGKLNAEQSCNVTSNLCPDRTKYLFWDLFHPTQAAANLAAITLYSGPAEYVTPINFKQLQNIK